MSFIWRNKMADEVWKEYPLDKRFLVSNFGNVKSFKTGKIYKTHKNKQGYLGFVVSLGHRRLNKLYKIHRMVAQTFIPHPEFKPCVNHIDGDKTNNCVGNLEWVTYQENTRHAFRVGLCKPTKSVNRKLTDEQIRFIRCRYIPWDKNFGGRSIARSLGIDHSVVQRILKRERYKDVK